MTETLSRRCQNIAKDNESVNYILESLKNPFHPVNNPGGFINMGTAVNGLTHDIIKRKLQDEHIFQLAFDESCPDENYNMFDYFQELGIPRLQKAAALFLDRFFDVAEPTKINNLCFATGALSCLDLLCHFIGDPGDVVLCVTPQYPKIKEMITNRALLEMWPITLTSHDNFNLTMDKVEKAHDCAIQNGKRVCGFILLNPGNPIGRICEEDLLRDIMTFCARKSLHLVVDELYANSIHHDREKFKSVLSFQNIPDPNRTHLLYGISKDFGLTKFRIGFVHTYNKGIQNAWEAIAPCQAPSYPMMIAMARLLEDLTWCDKLFKESASRLANAFEFVSGRLTDMDIEHVQSQAGFFIWANFSKFCQPVSGESEKKLFQAIVDECQMYLSPGCTFHSFESGWFRIIFTKPMDELKEGLDRLENFITLK